MTAASPEPTVLDGYTGKTINVTANDEEQNNSSPPQSSSSALVATQGTFADVLAPLNKDTFREVVTDVEDKLKVVNQTLSLLDNLLDSQGFEGILDEMLRSITLKTGELLGADRTTIFLLDDDQDELWAIVAKGDDGKPLEIRIPVGVGIAGEVAQFKEVINIPYDFYDDPRSAAAKEFDKKNHYRTYSMLALPLLSEDGELVAVVQLLNKLKTPHDPDGPLDEIISTTGFAEDDIKVFEEFAPSIRLILESSRSFYKATQRQRAANALIEATNSLSKGNLDLDATLNTVMDAAKKLMNADRSTLWLINDEKTELWSKIRLPNGQMIELKCPMGVGFAGHVGQTGEILNIPYDAYEHPMGSNAKKVDEGTKYRTCSLLCMPVFNSDGDLIGVTQLVNKIKQGTHPDYDLETWPEAPECWKASFNRSDQEFMTAFNIQAGVALQNAKLFNQVKQQEQMQRDILRSLTNGVLSTDKNGYIIAANDRARLLLGFEDEPLEGKAMSALVEIKTKDITDKNDAAREGEFSEWFARSLNPKEDKDREQYYPDQPLISAAGEQHSVNLSINTISSAADPNNVNGVLVVLDDISDEKRLKSTMYRYMNQELAEQLLGGGEIRLGGDRREVSVLFSDIRSYTSLTEKLQAEEVVQMLNEYFESMVEAIFNHKGILDKYIGDAIMAVFGTPMPIPDHAWESVQSALEMRSRLAEFNAQREADNKDLIRIGIGINSGSVISGNIGSSKRMEFTAIGDGVNLSSRLESASKQYGCDIVISDNTYKQCKEHIWVRELDRIRVKGKTQPVSVYELVANKNDTLSSKIEQIIELYHRGRDRYLKANFALALPYFSTILELNPQDKAAHLHIQRCQYFLTNPVDEDWDGVWTMTTK
ncbi:GAF domain-containing protein [Lusitaniella coriacea LEGE 07157]|uniref:GAF domain-containing protein n=1 Tax=Lusitaniella coriacea LEGE 07157 TaxID=945747 RepID=A0A8J7E0S5_9CYAN|nr:adenylate/guanylate cyclase domain-containing protein [Lusitaniella coriacea]MBE9118422.1 GAF domain-containing protein [Lusitaniella coriacea LEGE 07157]